MAVSESRVGGNLRESNHYKNLYLLYLYQELNKSANIKNIYNVTPKFEKSAFIIISQVDDYCIQVTVTMTSTSMREEPTPEQAKGELRGDGYNILYL